MRQEWLVYVGLSRADPCDPNPTLPDDRTHRPTSATMAGTPKPKKAAKGSAKKETKAKKAPTVYQVRPSAAPAAVAPLLFAYVV